MWKLHYITEGFELRKKAENIHKESFAIGISVSFFPLSLFIFSMHFPFICHSIFPFFFLLFIATPTEASETIFKAKKINKAQERPSVTEKML